RPGGTDPPGSLPFRKGDRAMRSTPPGGASSLPMSVLAWVDEVCRHFEDAWKAARTLGTAPRIEDYLGDAPEPRRSALLRELILVDLEYRRRRGDTPCAEEYLARFPTLDAAWLTSLLGRRNQVEVPSTPSIADVSTGPDLGAVERITDRQPASPA